MQVPIPVFRRCILNLCNDVAFNNMNVLKYVEGGPEPGRCLREVLCSVPKGPASVSRIGGLVISCRALNLEIIYRASPERSQLEL